MKRIVIRVITYNQENVIERALNSILSQRKWGLYRVVVGDDCSSDRTWDILNEFQKKYPDIVYIYRNETNLGIYGNISKTDSYLPEADLYGNLSGDDEYCEGYFKAVQKIVSDENIDTTKPIGIFSNWKTVSPDGHEEIYKQNLVLNDYKLISLKIRGKIYSRSILVSKAVKEKYAPMILDRGLALSEGNYDLQSHLYIKKAYYIPRVTTIYYTDIGISTKLSRKHSDYFTTQFISMWEYFLEQYLETSEDIHYAKYEIAKSKFYIKPTWRGIFEIIHHNEKGQLHRQKDKLFSRLHFYLYLAKYKFTNQSK